MRSQLRKLLEQLLKRYHLSLVPTHRLQQLKDYEKDVDNFIALPEKQKTDLLKLLASSKAQMKQDLFVLSQLEFKKNGYFVEFGATDGVQLSNTYLLEQSFGWKGILAEPAKCWQEKLKRNRNSHIETDCVWKNSEDSLMFEEMTTPELSTIAEFLQDDFMSVHRVQDKKYKVNTISLIDLLEKYDAPKIVDYLSIDTEGSEYEILKSFDFTKYQFRIITCEHNYTQNRDKILNLLSQCGYERRFTGFSKCDDWYVNKDLV